MNWDIVSAFGSLLSGAAAVIALLTVLYTIRQTREMSTQTRLLADANMAGVYERVNSMMLEINRYFFDHPEWRPYFYDGKAVPPDLDKRELGQIETLAEMVADFMDLLSVLEQTTRTHSKAAAQHWAEWLEYSESIMRTSPCVKEFVARRESWYDPRMRELAQESARQNPPLQGDSTR